MSEESEEIELLDGDKKIGRATFVKTAVGGFALLWGGMTLYRIYRYLCPSSQDEEDAASKVSSLDIGKVSDFPSGSGKNFKFGSTPALIIHGKDGQFHAFKAVCTHLGCTVQYRKEKNNIWCACHGGAYDPDSGKNIAGPPPKPLSPLKVDIVNERIIISNA